MTDIVYITGGKSLWNNNELRYSLRSLVKFLGNMGDVYVVGSKPEWLTNVIHIPAEDKPHMKKEPRLMAKRVKACQDERISERALFIYDDEYLLQPHDADYFPYYYQGNLEEYLPKLQRPGHHKSCTANTIAALKNNGYSSFLYDIHCPMLVRKAVFLTLMGLYDWSKRDGYLIKSTYANSLRAVGTATRDLKINHPDGTLEQYREMIQGRQFFSTGDNMNWPALQELMEKLYPIPSKFELCS